MKKSHTYYVMVIFTLLSLLLSACDLDLGGAAGAVEEPTATEPAIASAEPLATDAPTEEPLAPTVTPIPLPSGRILYISNRDGANHLYMMDAPAWVSTSLTNGESADEQPQWSPDGTRVAFASTLNNNTDIYVVNADGSGLMRVTDDPGKDASPSWSPDGQWLAFESFRDGNYSIYVVSASGGIPVRLTNDTMTSTNPQWSPADGRIAFTSRDANGNSDVFLIHQDGSGLFQLTSDTPPTSDPAWSRDGGQIAYRAWSGDMQQVWVIGADGSNPRSITNTGVFGFPAWSSTGRLAFFAGHSNGLLTIEVMDALGNLTSVPVNVQVDAYNASLTWSPDGAYVVFQANAEGNMEIFLLTVDTGELVRLTNAPGYDGMPLWH